MEKLEIQAIIRFTNGRELEVVETVEEVKDLLAAGGMVEVNGLHKEVKRKFPTPVDTKHEVVYAKVPQLINASNVAVVADVMERPVHSNEHAHMEAVSGPFSKM